MARFLRLLGKNGDSRLRAFAHKATPEEVKRKLSAGLAVANDVIKAQQAGLGFTW